MRVSPVKPALAHTGSSSVSTFGSQPAGTLAALVEPVEAGVLAGDVQAAASITAATAIVFLTPLRCSPARSGSTRATAARDVAGGDDTGGVTQPLPPGTPYQPPRPFNTYAIV